MSRLAKFGFIDARRTTSPIRPRRRSRGIPHPLEPHEIFYTESLFEAAELIGKALSPNQITLAGSGADDRGPGHFAAGLHGVRLRDVRMFYLDLHVAATLEMPCTGPYFAVHMPTNGTARCTVDGRGLETDTTRAMVTSPGQAVTMRLSDDCPQLIIRIEREALTRHLTRLLGRALTEAVVFEPALNLISDPATRWHSAIQLVNTEVFHGGSLLQRGHGIGPLEELIMSTLAYLQPSTVHEHLLRPGAPAGRAVVRQSLEYLEAHLREAITVADLARHVHMSVRAVQQAFREELDTTPMAYLRDRRLERARQELADALASDGVTVTAVAEHWGFGHLSNFAALYRRRWGESPSDTLHR